MGTNSQGLCGGEQLWALTLERSWSPLGLLRLSLLSSLLCSLFLLLPLIVIYQSFLEVVDELLESLEALLNPEWFRVFAEEFCKFSLELWQVFHGVLQALQFFAGILKNMGTFYKQNIEKYCNQIVWRQDKALIIFTSSWLFLVVMKSHFDI